MKKALLSVVVLLFVTNAYSQFIYAALNSGKVIRLNINTCEFDTVLTDYQNMFDIAMCPDGYMYITANTNMVVVDTTTWTIDNSYAIISPPPGLVCDSTNTLYYASDKLYTETVTPDTTVIGNFLYGTMGDITFKNDTLYQVGLVTSGKAVLSYCTFNPYLVTVVGQIGSMKNVLGITVVSTGNCIGGVPEKKLVIGSDTNFYYLDPITLQTTYICNIGQGTWKYLSILGLASVDEFVKPYCAPLAIPQTENPNTPIIQHTYIYDLTGKLVFDGPGAYKWNATSNQGEACDAGIYFEHIIYTTAGKAYSKNKKFMLVR